MVPGDPDFFERRRMIESVSSSMLSFQMPGLSVCMTTAMTSRLPRMAALTSTCWAGIGVAGLHARAAGKLSSRRL